MQNPICTLTKLRIPSGRYISRRLGEKNPEVSSSLNILPVRQTSKVCKWILDITLIAFSLQRPILWITFKQPTECSVFSWHRVSQREEGIKRTRCNSEVVRWHVFHHHPGFRKDCHLLHHTVQLSWSPFQSPCFSLKGGRGVPVTYQC